ncbi:MAG: FkbM family methyltransferase [Hyphomicrobiales bacterium]
MMRFFKTLLRSSLKALGYELTRLSQSPAHTQLGLARRPIGTIIDVGANRGQFAQQFSKIFPKAEIHSFEPLPKPYQALQQWAESQGDQISTYNFALGDSSQTTKINHHVDHDVSSSMLKRTDTGLSHYPVMERTQEVSIEIKRLDDIFPKRPARKDEEILLKIDVQGYEETVLKGAGKFLTFCDIVILEISMVQLYAGQADFRQLCNKLGEAGFVYEGNLGQYYADEGHVIFIDALFCRKKK